ncbi:hypothetical protein H4R24_004003 [Coemansia sp. RSA 988]|nr:hypothetical protein H4R24_004003 [Coemansia sp. RSA 988]
MPSPSQQHLLMLGMADGMAVVDGTEAAVDGMEADGTAGAGVAEGGVEDGVVAMSRKAAVAAGMEEAVVGMEEAEAGMGEEVAGTEEAEAGMAAVAIGTSCAIPIARAL